MYDLLRMTVTATSWFLRLSKVIMFKKQTYQNI